MIYTLLNKNSNWFRLLVFEIFYFYICTINYAPPVILKLKLVNVRGEKNKHVFSLF